MPGAGMIPMNDARAVRRIRRQAWRFQSTFHTPLQRLDPFVDAILAAIQPMERGKITIDACAFESTHLKQLCERYSIHPNVTSGFCLEASGPLELAELLGAAFLDWTDFVFEPAPKSVVIYADHDEYTTFFSMSHARLQRIAKVLEDLGCRRIEDYRRSL